MPGTLRQQQQHKYFIKNKRKKNRESLLSHILLYVFKMQNSKRINKFNKTYWECILTARMTIKLCIH